MNRLGSFLLGVAMGAVGVALAMHYHLVRADDGMHLVPKLSRGFQEPYVDIRDFSPADWRDHSHVAAAILRAEKGHLLSDPQLSKLRQSLDHWLDGLTAPR